MASATCSGVPTSAVELPPAPLASATSVHSRLSSTLPRAAASRSRTEPTLEGSFSPLPPVRANVGLDLFEDVGGLKPTPCPQSRQRWCGRRWCSRWHRHGHTERPLRGPCRWSPWHRPAARPTAHRYRHACRPPRSPRPRSRRTRSGAGLVERLHLRESALELVEPPLVIERLIALPDLAQHLDIFVGAGITLVVAPRNRRRGPDRRPSRR
jgi:hypothetical protein